MTDDKTRPEKMTDAEHADMIRGAARILRQHDFPELAKTLFAAANRLAALAAERDRMREALSETRTQKSEARTPGPDTIDNSDF